MHFKIKSRRDFRGDKSRRATDNFTLIAISSSVLAFLAGVAIAFFQPIGVHSQQSGDASSPSTESAPVFHLKREFIYLGSRLIAIDEAGARPVIPDEPMVWSPRTGLWRGLGDSEISPTVISFGDPGDEPFLADMDGDGIADRIVLAREDGKWKIKDSFAGSIRDFRFGSSTDRFSINDFDGDGRADIAAFDVEKGTWLIRYSDDGKVAQIEFGLPHDIPCVADFDGDGRADIAVWRGSDSTVNFIGSADAKAGAISVVKGVGRPVCADFDGDGRGDVALVDESEWSVRFSRSLSVKKFTVPDANGIPVVADYDGDGRADLATWNGDSSVWNILESRSGAIRTFRHGQKGDIPLAGLFRR